MRLEFAYDGDGLGKGGDVSFYVDGVAAGSGRIEETQPIAFGYEYTDVGRDSQSPVTNDYGDGDNAFTCTIEWTEMESGQDGHDHLVDPEDFIRVAMARQ